MYDFYQFVYTSYFGLMRFDWPKIKIQFGIYVNVNNLYYQIFFRYVVKNFIYVVTERRMATNWMVNAAQTKWFHVVTFKLADRKLSDDFIGRILQAR